MNKRLLLSLVVLLLFITANAQDYKTYTYFKNDTLSLDLDLFLPDGNGSQKTPLVIFVHGGGFSAGDRVSGHSLARYLAKNNIACATISYTLYMKGKNFSCNGLLHEKIKAIQIAASQLWCATDYLLQQSSTIHIDTSLVFLAGSSAGAETVLHAAYWNRKQMHLFDNNLPEGFRYAAIISGAGAIMDLNLITPENIIPLMAFHGDADKLVPYATAAHHYCPPDSPGWLMLFGSYSIAKHLEKIDGVCMLITSRGGGHAFCGEYFNGNHQPIVDFILRIIESEKFFIYQTYQKEKD